MTKILIIYYFCILFEIFIGHNCFINTILRTHFTVNKKKSVSTVTQFIVNIILYYYRQI